MTKVDERNTIGGGDRSWIHAPVNPPTNERKDPPKIDPFFYVVGYCFLALMVLWAYQLTHS
jgi:hypothetical protein